MGKDLAHVKTELMNQGLESLKNLLAEVENQVTASIEQAENYSAKLAYLSTWPLLQDLLET